MNTADRSLSLVDYALRRRFLFFELEPEFKSSVFRTHLVSRGVENATINQVVKRMPKVNKKILKELGAGYRIGHSFFCPSGNEASYGQSWYDNIVNYEIGPLVEEYFIDNAKTAQEIMGILRS